MWTKKTWPLMAQLALNGLAHNHVVIFGEHGVDRLALLGRRVDGAHVADAAQAHVQRARDGRGAQREHIDFGAKLLELLLLGDAEALLLVDDQHAQIFEFQLAAQQAVGADDQVDGPGSQPFENFSLLGLGAETTEHLHADGEVAQPLAEGAVVLLGQDRGRHQNGHLFAVHDRLEGGAHGHFGLAVAHVAADQPIHGLVRLHVVLDGVDGGKLVFGLLKGEVGLQLLLPRSVRAVGVAGDQLALGIELEQIVGDLGDGPLGPLLDRLPSRPCPAG